MEVTFTLTSEDVQTYYQDFASNHGLNSSTSRQPLHYLAYYSAYSIIPIIACLLVIILTKNLGNGIVAGVAVVYIWRWPFYKLWQRLWLMRSSNNPGLSGLHTISLKPEGVSDKTSEYEYITFWPTVTEIVLTERTLLFFCERGTITPLPRRAFVEPEQAEDYFREARVLWKASVWPPPPKVVA